MIVGYSVVLFMLVVIVFLHELMHALVAHALGYEVHHIYIGFPLEFTLWGRKFSTNVLTLRWRNLPPLTFSLLLIGGGADIDSEKMWSPHVVAWKKVVIALYGPATNILLALLPLVLVFQDQATWIFREFSLATVQSLWLLVAGEVPAAQVGGPVEAIQVLGQAVETDQAQGMMFSWVLLNISLAYTNLLPIPAIDGGHIITSLMIRYGGSRGILWAKRLSRFFMILLIIATTALLLRGMWRIV